MCRVLLSLFCCLNFVLANYAQDADFASLSEAFEIDYEKLNLPYFRIDYKENLEHIQSLDSVLIQEDFFLRMASEIKSIDRYRLSTPDRKSFELLRYEINLNLERINLEKKWLANLPDSITSKGVYHLNIGKDWYRYLLHYWIDRTVEPEQLFEFGKSEVERVKSKIESIQIKSGLNATEFKKHINSPAFFYNSPEEVQSAFEVKKQQLSKLLAENFPSMDKIAPHEIKHFDEVTRIQTPAFYKSTEKTFYFNYFDRPFNKRQIAWIYCHEANPGHHYQIDLAKQLKRSNIQNMFRYSGYREGWAAYVEEIGNEIGAYDDIYDELGKWEWDIIRSVRIVLDIGMNYYGWDDAKALAYWKEHIEEQDDIALREIKRMRHWPAQVITYKYGADKILKWRSIFEKKAAFNLKEFHSKILESGDMPFSVLEQFVLGHDLLEINNIPYVAKHEVKDEALQRLNLIIPKAHYKPPLLLWIGGGAWSYVDRHKELDLARRLGQEGIAVASVGHRLSAAIFHDSTRTHGIQHPEHINDISIAFKWLYDHAEQYGYDKNKIFVGGFSSGAHLAALLSMDNQYLKKLGLDKSNIKGVIPIGGTYDIPDYKEAFVNSSRPHLVEQHVHSVFSASPSTHLEASPTSYIDQMSVPMLLISDRNMIGYTNVFEEKILNSDFQNIDFLYVRNLNHSELWRNLSFADNSKYRKIIVDFILD